MSIKPIDYINVISKSNEVSRIKHIENEKVNIQFQQGIINQKKHMETELKRVKRTNKSQYKIVDKYSSSKENNNKYNKRSKGRKKEEGPTDTGTKINIKI
ncbi:MAG: hypothetical protein GXZ06_04330 [Tissierellia bacterium]|nr:hypothetical protein [Tissierellia bacterium]